MLRVCAAVGFACAAASKKSVEGFSTLQSVRRHVEMASSSSSSQLAVAQKMQQTLSNAVKSVLDASDPEAMARLADDFIQLIEDQMLNMKTALIDENNEDKASIVTANEAVAQCNTDRNHSFEKADGVDFQQYETNRLRGLHEDCREQEVTDADQAESDCNEAQRQADEAVLATPICSDADRIPSDMNDVNAWVTELSALQEPLHNAVVTCNQSTNDFDDKAEECDTAQSNFEAQFCVFATDLNDTCDTHCSCYEQAFEARTNLETTVRAKEVSQKELWAAVCNIHCYIELFKDANESNLLENRHEECLDGTYECPNGADSVLDITYTPPVERDDCNTDRQWWNTTEYDDLNQTYIDPSLACVGDWTL